MVENELYPEFQVELETLEGVYFCQEGHDAHEPGVGGLEYHAGTAGFQDLQIEGLGGVQGVLTMRKNKVVHKREKRVGRDGCPCFCYVYCKT